MNSQPLRNLTQMPFWIIQGGFAIFLARRRSNGPRENAIIEVRARSGRRGFHLAKAIQINPEETIAREFADRLILAELSELQTVVKLSEIADRLSNHGLGLAAVRSLLASNPNKFAYSERRWIPAARLEGFGRPLSEAIKMTIERFGGPMPLNLLVSELQLLNPLTTEETVLRSIERGVDVGITEGNLLFSNAWAFRTKNDSVETELARNKVSASEVEEIEKKIGKVNFTDAGEVVEALKKAAPVSAKAFGAVAWKALNPQDPKAFLRYDWRKFYAIVFAAEGMVYAADGTIHSTDGMKKWLMTAVKVAERLAPTVEIEDAAPIEVKSEDVDRMVKRIQESEASITATKILEDFYEITPSVKTFPDDLENVMAALRTRSEVLWVGGDRFNKKDVVPELVMSVPDIFKFETTDFKDDEGEFIDSELNDDGLSSTLRKLLNHPLAMDVLDQEAVGGPKSAAEDVRCVLKSIHRELGTFPTCQLPTGFIGEGVDFQELIFIDPNGREVQAWANMRDRLIFGLIDWFYENPVESGAVFQLTRTSKPNVYEFAWLDQTDPVVFITSQRMEELRELQSRSEELSTYDILREVMSHWPKGADYLTLLWEVNVVRRSSRRLVASLLSSYACFYQRSGSPVWHYDAKKVEQGFDKTKRKFILRR